MDQSWRQLFALCLVVVGLQVVAPAAHSGAKDCQDRGGDHVPTTGAIFNDPTGDRADQFRIIAAVVKNINATPPGEVIRITTLTIKSKGVVTAITAARECRVQVRVVVPSRAWEDHAVVKLREVLGSDVSRNSYITQCEGSCTTEGADGIMHVKSYQFSKVQRVRHVTIYSSSNLTTGQAMTRWNDAFQVAGDADVYSSAAGYFDKLVLDAEVDFPRLTKAAGYWQYYFPTAREFHLDVLGVTGCGARSGPTSIDLASSIWKQVDVAERIADLHDAGCVVRIVLNLDKIEPAVLQTLHDREVPTRVHNGDDPDGATHSKYIAIRGKHDGYIVRTVYCGSANVSAFSTHTADNSMLRIVDDRTAYAAYRRNFDQLWDGSRPLSPADIEAAGEVDGRAAELRD